MRRRDPEHARRVRLAARELLRQARIEDLRHAANAMLSKLDALDAFARTRRDWARPLN